LPNPTNQASQLCFFFLCLQQIFTQQTSGMVSVRSPQHYVSQPVLEKLIADLRAQVG
jgi:hypothetical protein